MNCTNKPTFKDMYQKYVYHLFGEKLQSIWLPSAVNEWTYKFWDYCEEQILEDTQVNVVKALKFIENIEPQNSQDVYDSVIETQYNQFYNVFLDVFEKRLRK